jgi:hypothetical protein
MAYSTLNPLPSTDLPVEDILADLVAWYGPEGSIQHEARMKQAAEWLNRHAPEKLQKCKTEVAQYIDG